MGKTTSDQLWTPSVGTASRDGYLVGGFAEVGLSGESVSVRVEGDYVQRGAIVERDSEGAPVAGEIRTEYLSFALHVKLSKSIGPLSVHIALGDRYDQPRLLKSFYLVSNTFDRQDDEQGLPSGRQLRGDSC